MNSHFSLRTLLARLVAGTPGPAAAVPTPRSESHMLALEPRILFDAAALVGAAEILDRQPAEIGDAVDFYRQPEPAVDQTALAVALLDVAPPASELLVVDPGVDNWRELVDGVRGSVEVAVLDPDRDGIDQIRDLLAGRQPVTALHLLSHGAPGTIHLGGSVLDRDGLAHHGDALHAWGEGLSTDADILIYGCDVASGEDGPALVAGLARLTGADVAASDDPTGDPARGGDWSLEVRAGAVTAEIPFVATALADYGALLAVPEARDYTGGYTMDGVSASNWVDVPEAALNNAEGTISFSFTSAALDGSVHVLLANINDTNPDAMLLQYQASGGSWKLWGMLEGPSGGAMGWKDLGLITPQQTYHLAVTWRTDGSGTFFVDGTDVRAADPIPALISYATLGDEFSIGAFPGPFDQAKGTMTDLRIWTMGMTEAQVQAEMNSTTPVADITRLAMSWNFLPVEDSDTLVTLWGKDADTNDTLTPKVTALPGNGSFYQRNPDGSKGALLAVNDTVTDALGRVWFTPDADFDGSDAFTYLVNDGGSDSAAKTINFNMTAVQDAPTATNLSAAESFTEDAAAFSLTDIVITDPDSGDTLTATLTLSDAAAGTLSTATSGAVTSTFAGGVWSASGAVADVNTLLAGVTFTPAADHDQNFTIATSVSDGVAAALTGTKNVTVTAANDAPAITAGGTLNFTEGDAASVIDAALTITDVDDTDLESATVTISANYRSGKDRLLFTDTANITGVWNSGAGSLTLTGADTVANYQAALRSVTFQNDSDDPNTAAGTAVLARTIQWTANDGDADSAAATGTVNVTPVNDAPVLGGGTSNLSRTTRAVTIDNGLNTGNLVSALVGSAITDVDSTGVLEGIAVYALTPGRGAGWEYSIDGGATWNAVGAVAANSALLLRSSDRVRYVSDGADTDSASLSYRAWDRTGGTQGNKVDVSVNGAATPYSTAAASAGILVNDAPVLTTAAAPVLTAITEDDINNAGQTVTAILTSGGGSLGDVDTGNVTGIAITATAADSGNWQYSTNGGGAWSNFGSVATNNALLLRSTDLIRFRPDAFNPPGIPADTATFTYYAWDGTTGSAGGKSSATTRGNATAFGTASDTATISVASLNDAPVNNVPGAQTADEDIPLVFSSGNGNRISITDDASGDGSDIRVTLGVTGGALTLSQTTGLAFTTGDGSADADMVFTGSVANVNAALNGMSYGMPLHAFGADTLTITSNDLGNYGAGGALTDSDTVAITVNPVNDPPEVGSLRNMAVDLDGGNDRLLAALPTVFDDIRNNDLTVEFMARVDDLNQYGTWTRLFEARRGNNDFVQFNVPVDNQVQFVIREGGTRRGVRSDFNLTEGVWYHFAGTWDASANKARFYIDGQEQATGMSGNSGAGNSRILSLGSRSDGQGFTDGAFDELRIWNDIRTQAEIQANLDNALVGNEAGLAAYWSLDEGGGLESYDFTGANQDLILTDMDAASDWIDSGAAIWSDDRNKVGMLEDGLRLVQLRATDIESDDATLGFRITSLPANGKLYQYNAGAVGAEITPAGSLITDSAGRFFYQPNPDYNGADSFQYRAWDGTDNSVATATVNVVLDPVNDAPVHNLPAAQISPEDTALVFSSGNGNLISITDVDSGAGDIEVALSVTNGRLTLSQTTGLNFSQGDGTSDTAMTFRGTLAEVNAALAGMSYLPTSNYFGAATLSIATDDLGNAGEGGALTDADDLAITVTPLPDTPSVTDATTNEDVQSTSGLVITRNAADGAEVAFFKITNIANGALFRNDGTTVINSGDFITVAEGGAGLKFTPAADRNSGAGYAFGFDVQAATAANDGGLGGGTDSAVITVNAVNDAPVNTVPGAQGTNEDTALVFNAANGNLISVADDASEDGSAIRVTLSVAQGTLAVAGGSGASVTNDNSASVRLDGTVAQVNAALNGLAYTPDADWFGSDTLEVRNDDRGNTGLGGAIQDTDTIALTVNPVADTPTVTATVTDEDTQSAAGLVISPNGADGAEVTFFKITNITGGTLFQSDGTTPIVNGDFISVAQGGAGLKFTPSANRNSGAGDTFGFDVQASLSAFDAGLGGGTVGAAITVNAVNDIPVLTAGAALAYTENGAATAIDGTITVADVDHSNLASATVTISGGYENGADVLGFADTAAITGNWAAATGILTLTGSDTLANYRTALRSVTFRNTSEDPAAGVRTIRFVANDGTGDSVAVTSTVTVTAVNDAPVVTAGATLNHTEGAAAAVADATVTVADVDDANIAWATVTISGGYVNGEDRLGFVDALGITGGWNGAAGVLTLSGSASQADYQTALGSVTYANLAGDNPTVGARTLSFVVEDGALASAAATSSVTVTPVNDLATVTAGASLAFTEGDAATVIDGTVTLTDPDDSNLEGATVAITAGFVAGEDLLNFTNANGITGAWNGATGVLTLSGTATIANYRAALRSITYANAAGDNPTAGARTVFFVVNDGGGDSAAATSTVTVTPVNDAPSATAGAALAYSENDAATAIDATVTVADVDDANIEGATVTISAGYVNGEDVLGFVNANGITGAWSAATGVLTLSGTSSQANYQAALRSVTYVNSDGSTPSGGARTIRFVINDGALDSNAVTSTVTVTPVNDAPVVSAGAALAFTEGDAAAVVDGTVTVADPDHPDLERATVTIGAGFVSGEDLLAFTDANGISGSWDGAGGVLTLTGTTTLANYRTALRSVTYANAAGDNPTAGVRTVSFRLDDGSDEGAAATSTITVTAVNDGPVLTAGGALAYTENGAATAIDTGVTLTDPDDADMEGATVAISAGYVNGQDVLAFTNANGISGAWNAGLGVLTLSGTASKTNYQTALRSVTYANGSDDPTAGARSVSFRADDGALTSAAVTATVTVTAVNDAPVITLPAAQAVNEDANRIINGISVADADLGGADLEMSLSVADGVLTLASSAGLTFSAGGDGQAAMTFTGTAASVNAALNGLTYRGDADFNGADTLNLQVSDRGASGSGGARVDTDTLAITVNPVQDAPVANMDGFLTNEDVPVTITVATGLLGNDGDVDGDALALTSFTQPANGAVVDNGDGTLTYTPTLNYNGADSFTYTMNDGNGNSDTATVNITVNPVQDALNAVTDALTVAEDGSATSASVLTNDRDPDYNVGQADEGLNPALDVIGFTQAANGTVAYNNDGTFTYTATTADFFGADSFTYTLSAGDVRIDTGTVSVTVTAVNDAPVLAVNTGAGVNEGAAVTIGNALLRVTDVEQAATAITYTLATPAANGAVRLSGAALGAGDTFTQDDIDNSRITYLHDGSETVTDVFNVTVADGAGGGIAATPFAITIAPVNDNPLTAVNSGATVAEGGTVTIGNAVLAASDADNGAAQIVFTVTDLPDNGTLKRNGVALGLNDTVTQADIDGDLLSYTHDGGETAADAFTYTLADGAGGTAAATVFNLTVTAVNDTPVLATNSGGTLAEGGTLTIDSARLRVTDVDNSAVQLTYTVTALPGNGTVRLSGAALGAGGTFTQNDLDNNRVTYVHDSSETATDTFKFTVADGAGGVIGENSVALTVTPVNDAAVVTAGGALAYTENDAATAIDGTLTVTDSDDANLEGATVAISAGFVGGEDLLAFTNANGITGAWNGGTGVLTLSGTATVAQYQAALRSVTYVNSDGDDPTAGVRTLTWVTNDGGLDSAAVTSTVTVTAVNDRPVMTAGGALTYTENGAASAIDATLTVADVDDTAMVGATVAITGNYVNGEDLLAFTDAGGITGAWSAATGVLTLSGASSTANYQAALRSVTYVNSDGDDPTGNTRTVRFRVDDGDAVSLDVTSAVTVVPVNDAPVLTAGGVLNHTENGAAAVVDGGITVADVDDTGLQGVTITISAGYDSGKDLLSFTPVGGISGAWDGAAGRLTLVGAASKADYQTALRSVTYRSGGDDPAPGGRTLSFVANDGGADSTAVTATVVVTALNDAPTLTAGGVTGYAEGDAATVVDGGVTVADPDDVNIESATITISGGYVTGEDVLAFTDAGGITGAWDGVTGTLTLSGAASVADYQAALRAVTYVNTDTGDPTAGARTVRFVVNDGDTDSAAATATVTVTPVNDVATLTAGGNLAYTEGDAAAVIDGAVTVGDLDDLNLEGAVVAITGNHVDGEDRLGFVDANGITGTWNAAGGALTLSGSASLADYQAALRSITYENIVGDAVTAGVRTIRFVADDGSGLSAPVTATVTVTAVNDRPIATAGAALAYAEDDPATAIDTTVTLSDSDDTLLDSATVTISGGYVNGQDVLAFTDANGITASWNGATGVLTLSGASSVANYQAALRSVTYVNGDTEAPTTGARTIRFVVDDGEDASDPVTSTVTVTATDDRPLVVTGNVVTYDEGDGAVAVAGAATVADVDDANLDRATVTIASGYRVGEDRLAFTDAGGITGAWDGATGVLTLSGSATVAGYQAALRGVTYENLAGDNPGGGVREVRMVADDGDLESLFATTLINVVPANDAATLTAGGSLAYTENDAATAIDAGITVTDSDDANLEGATVTISAGFVNDEDQLGFVDANGITGAWDATSGVLTLSGSATVAQYRDALRSVTYVNLNGDAPTGAARTIGFAVDDGGGLSATASATVTVTAVNDAPVITLPAAQTVNEEADLVIAGIVIDDVDVEKEGAELAVGLSVADGTVTLATTAGLTFSSGGSGQSAMVFTGLSADVDAALAGVTYRGNSNYFGADTLSVSVSDQGGSGSGGARVASAALAITVTPVQDAPNAGNDGFTTAEDTALVIDLAADLLGNDSDVDGDALTITAFTQPGLGAVVDNGDGTWRFTPLLDYNGVDSFTYTLSDGQGGSDTATITVVVAPIPDTLDAVADAATVAEDAVVTTTSVLVNDRDPDYRVGQADWGLNPALDVIGFTQAANGTAVYNGDGTFTYTPDADFNGSDSLTYTLNAGDARTGTGTLTFTVTPVNDAPTWTTNAGVTLNEGASVVLGPANLAAADLEQAADALTCTLDAAPANGLITLNGVTLAAGGTFTQDDIDNGRVAYVHDGSETTGDGFTVTLSDGAGATLFPAAFAITVAPVNDVPVLAVNTGAPLVEGEAVTIANTQLAVTDADNSRTESRYTVTVLPVNGLLQRDGVTLAVGDGFTQADIDADLLRYRHDGGETVSDRFRFTVADGVGGVIGDTAFTFAVTGANDPPVLNSNSAATVDEGEVVTIASANLSVGDVENSAAELQYRLTAPPDNGGLERNGVGLGLNDTFTQEDIDAGRLAYRHDGSETVADTFRFTVADGAGGGIGETVFSLSVNPVNDAPLVSAGAALAYAENGPAAVLDGTILVTDVDSLQLTGATVAIGSGFERGQDVLGFTDSAVISGAYDWELGVLTLSGTATTADYQAALRRVTYVNTDTEAPVTGARSVSWVVSDGSAGSAAVTSTVTITAVNDRPTATAGALLAYSEGEGARVVDGTVTVADVDNATLSGARITLTPADHPRHAEDRLGFVNTSGISGQWDADSGVLTLTGVAGVADYQAALRSVTYENSNGDDPVAGLHTVEYAVDDGEAWSVPVSAAVAVAAVNDAPVITVPGARFVPEDTNLVISGISIQDPDLGGGSLRVELRVDNGLLTLGSTTGLQFTAGGSGQGTMIFSGTASAVTNAFNGLIYRGNPDFSGGDTLSLSVSDLGHSGGGAIGVDVRTVAIAVSAVQDAPVASIDALITAEDTPITFDVIGALLDNDSDVDGDTLTLYAFTDPGHGTLTRNADDSLTYLPDLDYNGIDSFTYTVDDGNGNLSTVAATIVVEPIMDGLTAGDDVEMVDEDGTLTTGNLLANDRDPDFIPDGNNPALAIIGFGKPAHGVAVYQGGGVFSYRPDADFFGTDTFTYTLNAGDQRLDVATVHIIVRPVNDLPEVAVNGGLTLDEGGSATIGSTLLRVADADQDVSEIVLTLNSAPGQGGLTLGGAALLAGGEFTQADIDAGRLVYTHDGSETLTDLFRFSGRDGQGGTLPMSAFAVTVNPVNDAPTIAVNIGVAVDEGGEVAIGPQALSVADVDNGAADLVFTITASPGHGQLLNDGTPLESGATFTQADIDAGRLRFRHDGGETAADAFTFRVADGGGGTIGDSRFDLTVNPVNDRPGLTVPEAQRLDEDGVLAIQGVSIQDVDAGAGNVTVTLSVGHGRLDLGTVAGLGFGGGADGQPFMTFSGGLSAVNAALAGLTYRGNLDFNGDDTLSIRVDDQGNSGSGGAKSRLAQVAIQVDARPDPPVAGSDALFTTRDTPLVIDVAADILVNDVDMDGGTPSLTGFGQPDRGTLEDNGDGTLTFAPESGFRGVARFSYTVSDGLTGATGWVTVVVDPIFGGLTAGDDTVTTQEDAWVVTGDFLANDRDPDHLPDGLNPALKIIGFTQAEHGRVVYNGDGTFTYHPDADYFGTDRFSYIINAGDRRVDVGTANVTVAVNPVNDRPVVTINSGLTLDEDQTAVIGPALLRVADAEQGAAELLFTLESLPTRGELRLDGVVLAAGNRFTQDDIDHNRLTYRHLGANANADRFGFSLEDGAGGFLLSNVFDITIRVTNDDPVLAVNLGIGLDEGGWMVIDGDRLRVADSDNSAAELRYQVTQVPDQGQLSRAGAVLRAGDRFTQADIDAGLVGYRHGGGEAPEDGFYFVVTDGAGGSIGETFFAITVNPVNEAPILTLPNDQHVEEDVPLLITGMGVSDVDVGDGLLQVRLSVGDGTVTLLDTQGLQFSDGGSGRGAMTFTGTLEAVNRALAELVYRGRAQFHGEDALAILVSDQGHSGGGDVRTASGTVPITVRPVQDPPSPGVDALFVEPDASPLTFDVATALLGNDSDHDGNPFVVDSVTQPGFGTLIDNGNGTLTYIPGPDFDGWDSFSYIVIDSTGRRSQALVVIVNPIRDGLDAGADTLTTREDLAINSPNLLANDRDPDFLPDGRNPGLVVIGFTQAAHGVVTYNSDGTFTYRPGHDFFGDDAFTYTINTGDRRVDSATVTITVLPENDAPFVAINAGASVDQGRSLTISHAALRVGDVDNPAADLRYRLELTPEHGTLSLNGVALGFGETFTQEDVNLGRVSYRSGNGSHRLDGFTFTLLDGSGGFVVATRFAIHINQANPGQLIDITAPSRDRAGEGDGLAAGERSGGGFAAVQHSPPWGGLFQYQWQNQEAGRQTSGEGTAPRGTLPVPAGSALLASDPGGDTHTPILSVVRGHERTLALSASGTPVLTAVMNSNPGVMDGGMVTPVLTAVKNALGHVAPGGSTTPVLTAVVASRADGIASSLGTSFPAMGPSSGALFPGFSLGGGRFDPFQGRDDESLRRRSREAPDRPVEPLPPLEPPPLPTPPPRGRAAPDVVAPPEVPDGAGAGPELGVGDGAARVAPSQDFLARIDALGHRFDREAQRLLDAIS